MKVVRVSLYSVSGRDYSGRVEWSTGVNSRVIVNRIQRTAKIHEEHSSGFPEKTLVAPLSLYEKMSNYFKPNNFRPCIYEYFIDSKNCAILCKQQH